MAKPPDKAGVGRQMRDHGHLSPRRSPVHDRVLCSWLPFSANWRSLGEVAAFVALYLCPCVLAVLWPSVALCSDYRRLAPFELFCLPFSDQYCCVSRRRCTCAQAVYCPSPTHHVDAWQHLGFWY
jgi:hypothetical protein